MKNKKNLCHMYNFRAKNRARYKEIIERVTKQKIHSIKQ